MTGRKLGLLEGAALLAIVTLGSSLEVDRRRDPRIYERQHKPRWAPPSWLFGLVWPVLNTLQIWGDVGLLNDKATPNRTPLLGLRGANWLLYFLFTPAYFRARSPVLGAAVAFAQTAVAFTTLLVAGRRAPRVTAATAPLAAWLSYASVLSVAVARRNRDPVVAAVTGR